MNTVFIFEDNENTPSSELLKAGCHGCKLYFSGGAGGLANKIVEVVAELGTSVKIVAYFDLIPNNPNTINLYKELKTVMESRSNWSNVSIVPILGIESLIARMCLNNGYFTEEDKNRIGVKYLVDTFDWSGIPDNLKKEYLERMYKRILAKSKSICLHNENKDNPPPKCAKFYKEDCDCRDCTVNAIVSRMDKSIRLYAELPLFCIGTKECSDILSRLGIEYYDMTGPILQQQMQEFYDNICGQMGVSDIDITTIRESL